MVVTTAPSIRGFNWFQQYSSQFVVKKPKAKTPLPSPVDRGSQHLYVDNRVLSAGLARAIQIAADLPIRALPSSALFHSGCMFR